MSDEEMYCNEPVARKVVYEFTMFKFLCDKLRSSFEETDSFKPGEVTYFGTGLAIGENDRTTFALLESLLLHTRVLYHFFYRSRSFDDVIASDFVPDWESQRPQIDEYLAARKERLNKAVAHLSLRRIEYDSNEKKWDVDAIERAIGNAMHVFLENLSEEKKTWFVFLD